jgi:hypothetical protein
MTTRQNYNDRFITQNSVYDQEMGCNEADLFNKLEKLVNTIRKNYKNEDDEGEITSLEPNPL